MNAVGIDVSKEKSTVAIYQPGDQVILKPRDFHHTQSDISSLISIIKGLDGETKVCMEHTGRYYEPVATWLSDAGACRYLALRCRYLRQCRESHPDQELRR